jgi:hypothetical protein
MELEVYPLDAVVVKDGEAGVTDEKFLRRIVNEL